MIQSFRMIRIVAILGSGPPEVLCFVPGAQELKNRFHKKKLQNIKFCENFRNGRANENEGLV